MHRSQPLQAAASQQSLANDFTRMGIARRAVTVVTQVEVAADDPAFAHPSKPIGTFMDATKSAERRERDGWDVVEDAGRGWRRVVASPRPLRIVEEDAVCSLIDDGFIVITVGGAGIPVVRRSDGALEGVAAVIDKDFASSLLARQIGAELFAISTAVERVALEWGTERQRWVDRLTLDEARWFLAAGTHFAPGSMAPKIEACIEFLEAGGSEAVITTPDRLGDAIAGRAGTHIVA